MNLFLDDSEDRIYTFLDMYDTDGFVITRTAQETIDALKNQSFDLVSLDHDLGGKQFQDSSEKNCGMEVVRWIVENKPPIEHIIVHSWNAPAAIRMANTLYGAGYTVERRPFGFPRVSLQKRG